MKQDNPQASQRAALPMELDVKIHALRTDGKVLANASVTLNGCFAVRGVKIMEGPKGPFVSLPSYKSGGEYRDICFPCTSSTQAPYPSLPGKPESSLFPLCLLFAADPLRWALPRCSTKRCWTPTSSSWPSFRGRIRQTRGVLRWGCEG